jgi:hypothetical protein
MVYNHLALVPFIPLPQGFQQVAISQVTQLKLLNLT